MQITKDHLSEPGMGDYYTRLKKMEKERMDARESSGKSDELVHPATNQEQPIQPQHQNQPEEAGQFSQLGDLGIEFEATPVEMYQPVKNTQSIPRVPEKETEVVKNI
ncbi:MAG: hypothetical protein NTV62_04415, partial [Candidatus Gribaldobacteria bacterium]|nr:hypothetical protein [Candidatus Gribaldobacteria bacterium]